MTITLSPRRAAASAQDNPRMPAPMIAKSNLFDAAVMRKVCQALQRSQEFLVIPPSPGRSRIDLLPHLPLAGGGDDAFRLVEIEAFRIPRQTDEVEHPPGPALLIFD